MRCDTRTLRNDRLGALVSELTSAFEAASSWEEFTTRFRGRSYLSEDINELEHPARELLQRWRDEGIPVFSNAEPWTSGSEQKDAAVE